MSLLDGRSILITGGTGTFGRRCAEMLLRECCPSRLIIYSRDEQKHVEMARSALCPSKHPQIRYFVGDVRDLSRLRRALRGVDFVIHAAAMKHVDIAEYNPQECIRTNIGGAENLIHACLDCGVKRLVALSTDKAASPVNLYGATKLCSDKLFVAGNSLSGEDGTRFSVVRYGNVLGSKGSVVPLFQRQRREGMLSITDPRMTRFIITLDEGVRFVMAALERLCGGEIFVPRIPSARLVDLAEAIAPGCRVQEIGIRPGEKLHECMIPEDESRQSVCFDDHYVIYPAARPGMLAAALKQPSALPCPDGFYYSSDTNDQWLSVEQLRRMIADLSRRTATDTAVAARQAA
jgi:UDP-N-acetylglucosamine 4,6-dehydratase